MHAHTCQTGWYISFGITPPPPHTHTHTHTVTVSPDLSIKEVLARDAKVAELERQIEVGGTVIIPCCFASLDSFVLLFSE